MSDVCSGEFCYTNHCVIKIDVVRYIWSPKQPIQQSFFPTSNGSPMTTPMRLKTMLLGLSVSLLSHLHATAQEPVERYSDSKYDFSISVVSPWKSGRLQDYAVPGVARAAYSRTDGASIVLFMQEPGKAYDPRFLVDESAKSMEKNLSAKVITQEVRKVAEMKAMWLIVQGPGTGRAIDGKSDVLTSQHWIAIPREKDVFVVLLTSPTKDFEENEKLFIEAVDTLQVGGKQTAAQSESK